MPAPLAELGYASNQVGGWWYDLSSETTPELRFPLSIHVYDRMRRQDAQVASVLRAVTQPVRRTKWRLAPNGAPDDVVALVADDLGLPVVGAPDLTAGRPRTRDRFAWGEHLRLALLMLPYGFMPFEQVYRIDAAGRARLRKLGPRMPASISGINVARDGGLESIEQVGTTGTGQVTIPVSRLVMYVNEREAGNWQGESLLRPAYKHWLLKDRLLRVQTQSIERNGMGLPRFRGQDGATDDDIAAGLDLAKKVRAGDSAGVALRAGQELDLIGVQGTLPNAAEAIRYHDERIASSALGHFMNLGQAAGTGSYALGASFIDFFTQSLQTVAQTVADTANQHIVEDIVDLNFGPDVPAPLIVFDEIGSRQQATAVAIKALIDAGAIFPDRQLEEALRQLFDLPPKPTPGG